MSYARAAREADPLHGRIAGLALGAWEINKQLTVVLRRIARLKPAPLEPDEMPSDLISLAKHAQEQQLRSLEILRALQAEINLWL